MSIYASPPLLTLQTIYLRLHTHVPCSALCVLDIVNKHKCIMHTHACLLVALAHFTLLNNTCATCLPCSSCSTSDSVDITNVTSLYMLGLSIQLCRKVQSTHPHTLYCHLCKWYTYSTATTMPYYYIHIKAMPLLTAISPDLLTQLNIEIKKIPQQRVWCLLDPHHQHQLHPPPHHPLS